MEVSFLLLSNTSGGLSARPITLNHLRIFDQTIKTFLFFILMKALTRNELNWFVLGEGVWATNETRKPDFQKRAG